MKTLNHGDIAAEYIREKMKLYLGDCMEILPTLEAGSVDAIITDLPYGITACKWDEIIPFEPMWAQVKRLLKQRGVFVTTASQPFTSKLVMSNLEWFKYEWIWNKKSPVGYLNAKKRPMPVHENVLVFCENITVYNPQFRKDVGKPFGKIAPTNNQVYGYSNNKRNFGVGYPMSILAYTRPCNITAKRNGHHPTQKPVALYEYLIRTYTNEGDTVLDFCMGSGTTGVAAVQLGRRFIGIEIDPGYFEIAKKRIEQAQLQMMMGLEDTSLAPLPPKQGILI